MTNDHTAKPPPIKPYLHQLRPPPQPGIVVSSCHSPQPNPFMIVTIDGPAGTGKSSVARALAERLGFEFLNTGAMYRAAALACLERNIPVENEPQVAEMTRTLSVRFAHNRIYLDGRDVSDDIRWDEVTQAASIVASNPEVRKHLVDLQRAAGVGTNLVTEGRDQGTIVFPHAECKFFLTASPEERAWRRLRELEAQGREMTIAELLAQQSERDRRDETRACAPLRPAEDAVLIDTSHLSLDAVVEELVRRVQQKNPKSEIRNPKEAPKSSMD